MKSRRRRLAPLGRCFSVAAMALALALVVGCGAGGNPDPGTSQPAQTRSQALIDAGNQAYRAGNYALPARRYAAAAEIKADDPAAYYGLGMALARLGHDEDARRAYARARELNRGRSSATP